MKLYVPNADIADLIVVGCSRGRLALVECETDGVTVEDMGGIDRSRPIFRIVLDAGASAKRKDPSSSPNSGLQFVQQFIQRITSSSGAIWCRASRQIDERA